MFYIVTDLLNKLKGQNSIFCPFFKRWKKGCKNKLLEDKKIKLDDTLLTYKKGFKWNTLPYTEIINAYLRIEEVNGRLCCGVASFDMHFLMLKTKSGELIKVEGSSKEIVKEILEVLSQKNDEIMIGFNKDNDK